MGKRKEVKFDGKKFKNKKRMAKYIYQNKETLREKNWPKTTFLWLFIVFFLGVFFSKSLYFAIFLVTILVLIYTPIFEFRKTKIQKMIKFYEDIQIKKGKVEVDGNWISKKEAKEKEFGKLTLQLEKQRKKYDNLSKNDYYSGEDLRCIDCDYYWTTRKSRGLPAKCPSCNSRKIILGKIDRNNKKIKILEEKIKRW